MKNRIALVSMATTMLCFCGLSSSHSIEQEPFHAETFAEALQTAQSMPRLHSLIVSHKGTIIVEEYFNGRSALQRANVKSVSKSVMSALVGIAIDKGHVTGLDQPISDYYAEQLDGDSSKENISIGNLLSMQAGLETTSFYNYGAWVLSDDWVSFALNQPVLSPPGTRMHYSTGNTHLLSAILTQATGQSTLAFARESLAQPLGIELSEWQQDPQGIYFGGNNMELTPRQMLAFGELLPAWRQGKRSPNHSSRLDREIATTRRSIAS